jgi:hypothetical protein
MSALVRSVCVGLVLVTVAQRGRAQAIPKNEYIAFEPLTPPRIVAQTRASDAFHLFGDPQAPAYRDTSPRDGIGDRRRDVLLALAVRFAPYMVKNTTNLPMDFTAFMRGRPSFPLFIDTWDVATARGHLLRTDSVDFAALVPAPCDTARASAARAPPVDDCRLIDVLRRFGPERTPAAAREVPERDLVHILYFDFPGSGPGDWAAELRRAVGGDRPRDYERFAKVYVHPFIHELPAAASEEPRYELVLQYWFFYPYNDSGNKHEGDWEHINVVIAARDDAAAPLGAATLERILAGATPLEHLVIRRVEYYFHHNVFLMDYTTPNVYQPRDAWEREVRGLPLERLGEPWVWTQIRRRAYVDRAETRVNTHPLVYIAGDNKGLDQLLARPGGTNRDSHASYPFPGLYKDVGPTGASEEIAHGVNYAELMADSARHAMERVVRYDDPTRLELVPDWERVYPLVLADAAVRRDWSWLVLPIQFGYPATRSPFAGVLKHVDTGNLSPLGPAYNGGWNRTGAAPGYQLYEPHLFNPLFAVGYQDNLANSWGFLNFTYPTLSLLPPLDLVRHGLALLIRPLRHNRGPTFFPKERAPFRVLGASLGVSVNYPGEAFSDLLLLPDQAADIDALIQRTDTQTTKQDVRIATAVSLFGETDIYVGHRFVSQNTLRHSQSGIEVDFFLPSRNVPGLVRGTLEMWEYTGSVRFNLLQEGVEPFLKAGYGLSWYRLTNIVFDSVPIAHPETQWLRQPSLRSLGTLLPNTWHVGVGLEVIPLRGHGTLHRGVDLGARIEGTLYLHRLGVPHTRTLFVPVPDPGVARTQLNAAIAISF